MSLYRTIRLGSLVIANGAQASSSLDLRKTAVNRLLIYGPGELDNAVRVQVSEDDSTWFDLQSSGADITIPADGAVSISCAEMGYLRVFSAGAETPARTLIVKGKEGA